MPIDPSDFMYRQAAFNHVKASLGNGSTITRDRMALPFFVGEKRLTLVDPQRGIHKPQAMAHLLSITTVVAAKGRKVWYEDQTKVHQDMYTEQEGILYSFMGQDPNARQNQSLREAAELKVPIIYFLGIKPSLYQALFPVFLTDWDAAALNVRVVFGLSMGTSPLGAFPERSDERCYACASPSNGFISCSSGRLSSMLMRAAVPSPISANPDCWTQPTSFQIRTSWECRSCPTVFLCRSCIMPRMTRISSGSTRTGGYICPNSSWRCAMVRCLSRG